VQLAWNEKIKAAKEAAAAQAKAKGRGHGGASSSSGSGGPPAVVGVLWKAGDKAVVTPLQIGQAAQELASSVHMKMLQGRSEWELMLLVGLVLESRATGKTAVTMQVGGETWAGGAASFLNSAPGGMLLVDVVLCLRSTEEALCALKGRFLG
jgi:hypothetical protein